MTTYLIGLFVDHVYAGLITEVEAEKSEAALRLVRDDEQWAWEQTFGHLEVMHIFDALRNLERCVALIETGLGDLATNLSPEIAAGLVPRARMRGEGAGTLA